MNAFIRSVLFGNYFYGICIIALSIEASLQQDFPLNPVTYYILVFAGTVLYYTHAYIAEPASNHLNKRTQWYTLHKKLITYSQLFLTIVLLCTLAFLLVNNLNLLRNAGLMEWLVLTLFPVTAALYYGSVSPSSATSNLRNNGWLKPFVIGYVWAGAVTLYPVLFYCLEKGIPFIPGWVNFLLFIKNFLFITLLCIMFDIKDYAADHNSQLKTFVVIHGLRNTIFTIIIPLSIMGLGAFIIYGIIRHFPAFRILINTFPFILLIIVAYSLQRRKSILYYLAIIDGLMLVKAICGIIGISLIK